MCEIFCQTDSHTSRIDGIIGGRIVQGHKTLADGEITFNSLFDNSSKVFLYRTSSSRVHMPAPWRKFLSLPFTLHLSHPVFARDSGEAVWCRPLTTPWAGIYPDSPSASQSVWLGTWLTMSYRHGQSQTMAAAATVPSSSSFIEGAFWKTPSNVSRLSLSSTHHEWSTRVFVPSLVELPGCRLL